MVSCLRNLIHLAAACALVAPSLAQSTQPLQVSVSDPEGEITEKQTVTVEEYLAHIAAMETRVAHCKASSAACDGEGIATHISVSKAGSHSILLRQEWLSSALATAKTSSDADRLQLMDQSDQRLRDEAAEIQASPTPTSDAATARRDADQILARREFQYVQQETWLTRRWALFLAGVGAVMSSLAGRLPSAPWVVPVVEGGFLLAAAVGVLLWAWRTTQQQRVALSTSLSVSNTGWQRESEDWAKRAEAEAAAGAWREAVHCLYWAAIVLLEGRRLWRANRARTPREYLPLLEAGSAVRTNLSGLTRIFERIWYGLRPASQSDYEQAQALLETLKAS